MIIPDFIDKYVEGPTKYCEELHEYYNTMVVNPLYERYVYKAFVEEKGLSEEFEAFLEDYLKNK